MGALRLAAKGAVIVDVRLAADFEVGAGRWDGWWWAGWGVAACTWQSAGWAGEQTARPARPPGPPCTPHHPLPTHPACRRRSTLRARFQCPCSVRRRGTSGWDNVKKVCEGGGSVGVPVCRCLVAACAARAVTRCRLRPGRQTHLPLPAAPPCLGPASAQFVMGSLAMKATERDPAFIKNFEAAVGGGMFAKRKQSTRGALDWGVWVRWRHSSRMPQAHPGASSLPPRSPRHPPAVIVACSRGRHAGHNCAGGGQRQERQGPRPLVWAGDAEPQGCL